MAWNQPGGAGDKDPHKDPWGRRKSDQTFDIDQFLANFANGFRRLLGIGGNQPVGSGFAIALIAGVIVAIWALSGFYIVQQGERGVLLRFGEKIDVIQAGLRWHWPYPIERVEKVNLEKAFAIQVGYRINPRNNSHTRVPKESLMLTQDESIVSVEFAVQYKIVDPEAYLFNVKDPESTITQLAEFAVRESIGKRALDNVLTDEGRGELVRDSYASLQKLLERYKLGVSVVSVDKPAIQPPDEVKSAFDDVAKVMKESRVLKSEAESYANEIIPRARAAAARQAQEAESYKASVITRAEGDARRFAQIANEYLKAPAITRERLYIETMEQVMSNATKVFVDQKNGSSVIQLPLDKLVPPADAANGSSNVETDVPSPPAKAGPNPRSRTDQRARKVTP